MNFIPYTNHILPEPKRDFVLGIFSGHRLTVISYLIGSMVALYFLQAWFWPLDSQPVSLFGDVWSWGALLWITSAIPGSIGLIGLIMYKHPTSLDHVRPMQTLVTIRIVSRGTNTIALTRTIRRCRRELARLPLFPYIIEVVIDMHNSHLPQPNSELHYLEVPNTYQTKNKSLYKARALQYAIENSKLPNNAWIVHLDEETQLTISGIKGICAMIQEEETSGKLRIGQGAILYHRNLSKHPIMTLADNVRTGDDFSRFHFQNKLGLTLFGLHGSYIVVRNDIEKSIGFDFGINGSITEDAFWALVAMEHGYRCRWVDGYLEEQSTESIMDFVKQRRRWFQGLTKVALYAPVKRIWRLSLGINTILWALAPFASLYTIAHFFYGFSTTPWLHFLANFSFAYFGVLYLIGLKTNLDEYGMKSAWRRFVWTVMQIVLIPVFNAMEGTGVLMAIFRPHPGFHVVKK